MGQLSSADSGGSLALALKHNLDGLNFDYCTRISAGGAGLMWIGSKGKKLC